MVEVAGTEAEWRLVAGRAGEDRGWWQVSAAAGAAVTRVSTHSTVTCDTRGQSAAQHAAAQPPARHPPLLRPLPGAGHGPGHGEWVGAGTHTPGTSEAGKV